MADCNLMEGGQDLYSIISASGNWLSHRILLNYHRISPIMVTID